MRAPPESAAAPPAEGHGPEAKQLVPGRPQLAVRRAEMLIFLLVDHNKTVLQRDGGRALRNLQPLCETLLPRGAGVKL